MDPINTTTRSVPHDLYSWLDAQNFSLPLAVALGACSFEAYNLPYQMHGIKVRKFIFTPQRVAPTLQKMGQDAIFLHVQQHGTGWALASPYLRAALLYPDALAV